MACIEAETGDEMYTIKLDVILMQLENNGVVL